MQVHERTRRRFSLLQDLDSHDIVGQLYRPLVQSQDDVSVLDHFPALRDVAFTEHVFVVSTPVHLPRSQNRDVERCSHSAEILDHIAQGAGVSTQPAEAPCRVHQLGVVHDYVGDRDTLTPEHLDFGVHQAGRETVRAVVCDVQFSRHLLAFYGYELFEPLHVRHRHVYQRLEVPQEHLALGDL